MARSAESESRRGRFFAGASIEGGFLWNLIRKLGLKRAFRRWLERERDRSDDSSS